MNERDTHFQGFAKLLYDDFLQLAREDTSDINDLGTPDYVEKWRIKVEQLIAQRAYDLVWHTLQHATSATIGDFFGDLRADTLEADIPDLTEWPEN